MFRLKSGYNTSMRKLLCVFAHPDDESFTSAGTIAKYVKAGWQVDLVCVTRGEAGQTGIYGDISKRELSEIRTKEMETAMEILGIASVTFLDYRDHKLSALNPGELEDKIYQSMHELKPDVVITFEPNGISNHPDHSKTTLATTYVFQKYAYEVAHPKAPGARDPARYDQLSFAESEAVTSEPKLYYACMPESVATYLRQKKVIPGLSFGKPWVGVEDKRITTVIDTKRYASVKLKALRAHVSQAADVDKFLSIEPQPLVQQEFYILRMQGESEIFMGKNDQVSNRL